MTTREERYQIERAKWDAVASEKELAWSMLPPPLSFEEYARRSSTMVGVADFLGDLHGRLVLECGCGRGEVSTLLAKSGAKVTAFDLSARSVALARQRARLNDVNSNIDLVVAAGESLPFADESFDLVFGRAILHHLDVSSGWSNLYRVLKTGGKAAFVEPMGMNPILNWVRDHLPYPSKNPRGADRPLNYDEIHRWGHPYKEFRYQEIQLLSMIERGLGLNKRLPTLTRLDDVLLKRLPFLRRYCRYVVMLMVK